MSQLLFHISIDKDGSFIIQEIVMPMANLQHIP